MKLAIAPFGQLRRYVSRELWTTLAHLAEEHGWDRCEAHDLPAQGDLRPELRRRFGELPRVVLFFESFVELVRHFRPLAESGARVHVMTDDLHYPRDGMRLALRLAHGVLSTYAPLVSEVFPRVDASRVTWVPHAASPDFLLPLNESPAPVVLVSGSMSPIYAFRLRVRELALRRPDAMRIHDHPGYHSAYDYERDDRVGRGYANAIHDCLAAFTDASQLRYLVAKHFEIPAAGALLIADRVMAPQLAALGFVDGEHYVATTEEELEETVSHVLDPRNRAKIEEIRRRGHALVHERHTTRHRARQIDAVCV